MIWTLFLIVDTDLASAGKRTPVGIK